MKVVLLTVLASTLFIWSSYGQNESTIHGQVTDESGAPLSFINVYLEGTLNGTTTNQDGTYTLKSVAAGTHSLIVSGVSYYKESREVKVSSGQQVNLDIILREAPFNLNEVVITAARDLETLDEVPSSISILSGKKLQETITTSNNVADVLATVPGIAMSTNKTSNTGQTLRGRGVLVLIDGIPQSTPLRNGGRDINTIDLNAIERIEVIKGATSIYGNGSDGGIINYVTKKADKNSGFSSTTTLNNTGSPVGTDDSFGGGISQQFSGRMNGLDYLVSGSYQQTGVYKDANGEVISPTYGLGETAIYNFLGKAGYAFNAKNKIDVMYNFYSSNQNTDYVPVDGIYGEKPALGILAESKGVAQGNRFNHNAQLKYTSKKLLFNSDLNVDLYLQDFQTVYGFSTYFQDTVNGFDGGQSTILSSKKGARASLNTPFSFSTDFRGKFIYGVDIMNDVTSQELVDGRVWVPKIDMTNIAPYVQLKSYLFNDLVLKAGMRFENINIGIPDYQTILIANNGRAQGGVDIKGGKLTYDALTFNAGLRYITHDWFKPFISYSQSFSISDLGRTLRSATENTVSAINSEAVIVNNYEVGFSSAFTKFNVAGSYYISTSELGSSYVEVDGIFQIARQPEKVNGFELSVDAKPLDNLLVGASYSYVQGRFDGNNDNDYDDPEDNYINSDRIPPSKAVAYAEYSVSSKWDIRLTGIFNGSRDYFEADEKGNYSYGRGPVDEYTLVNLYTGYKFNKNTKLTLGVENLLNEDYYTHISQWSARSSNYTKGNGTRYNLALQFKF